MQIAFAASCGVAQTHLARIAVPKNGRTRAFIARIAGDIFALLRMQRMAKCERRVFCAT